MFLTVKEGLWGYSCTSGEPDVQIKWLVHTGHIVGFMTLWFTTLQFLVVP